jgi:hypothetical protein
VDLAIAQDYAPYYCEENIYRLIQRLRTLRLRAGRPEPSLAGRDCGPNHADDVPGPGHADPDGSPNLCGRDFALFITNPGKSCLLLHQKAAAPGQPVFWDYHVVLLAFSSLSEVPERPDDLRAGQGSMPGIWDLDTRLGLPLSAPTYLERTFPQRVPEPHRPFFRIIPADAYLDGFSSDRRHMRGSGGLWLEPPPPWPIIRGSAARGDHALDSLLDLEDRSWGEPVDRDGLLRFLLAITPR